MSMKVLNYLIMKGVKELVKLLENSHSKLITIMKSILLQYGDMATRDVVPELND